MVAAWLEGNIKRLAGNIFSFNILQCHALGVGKPGALFISALNGEGLAQLLSRVEEMLGASRRSVEALIPYAKYDAMAFLRSEGRILHEEHREDGTFVTALLEEASAKKLRSMLGEIERA